MPPEAKTYLSPAAKDLGPELPKSALVGSGAAGRAASELDRAASADGDALFDARRLQADDSISLVLSGYRFDEATSHILAPKTGEPVTNAQARALQNFFRESRSRHALLRLSRQTGPAGAASRKAALIDVNRDVLPREVLKSAKTGPEKEQAVVLRRLTSLYRRSLERESAADGAVGEPAAKRFLRRLIGLYRRGLEWMSTSGRDRAEEKLGALIAAAAVKRFSDDPEGVRLLNQLRDEHGKLRLPTMRVLRLDARYGALYTSYGRQLILSLASLKPLLLARLPEAEREEAEKSLATEGGALEYLSRNPASVATLAEAIDVTLFHELVHFRQDLERPLMTAIGKGEVPTTLLTYEHEYEAYFRQDLYIHSLLSRLDAKLAIDRIDDYLRLIDDFEAWKAGIDRTYAARFLNSTVALEELVELQDGSRNLIRRLAGPEDRRSAAASKRLKATERGTAALETERKAAEAELSEYRKRWPALARDGLRRWVEINEGLGRWPQVALAQKRLARLAESPADAATLNEKAGQLLNLALHKLANPEGLSLDERIEWLNALATDFNGRSEPWKKEMLIASMRDPAEKARELRAEAARAPEESVRLGMIARAEQFERTAQQNRAALHGRAEADLASVFSEPDPQRRNIALARGYQEAEVLGDAGLISAFKPLAQDPTEAGWSREVSSAADKAMIRLATGEGLSLDERIVWINALAAHFKVRREPWKKQLWVAFFRDYADKARELRTAKSGKDAASRADGFERAIDASRAVLRGQAEANLAALRAEADPKRRATLIDWGSMQAEMLGDAALSAAFKSLPNGPPAAERESR